MKIDYILVVQGIFLILMSLFFRGESLIFILPIGVIYLLISLTSWDRFKIFLRYFFAGTILLLLITFDEYLTSLPRGTVEKTFWYSGGGVCTEGTFCWIWGQFLPLIIVIVFISIGCIKAIRFQKSL
ncbi:MAG: hypothetical protein RJA61_169 [Candidatus Parcubacteria bacterium]|jgi:hypothetical protein